MSDEADDNDDVMQLITESTYLCFMRFWKGDKSLSPNVNLIVSEGAF